VVTVADSTVTVPIVALLESKMVPASPRANISGPDGAGEDVAAGLFAGWLAEGAVELAAVLAAGLAEAPVLAHPVTAATTIPANTADVISTHGRSRRFPRDGVGASGGYGVSYGLPGQLMIGSPDHEFDQPKHPCGFVVGAPAWADKALGLV
jgi:hypothetical protein